MNGNKITWYRAYRLQDASKPNTARNREYRGLPSPDREAVRALADKLNEEEIT